MKKKPYKKHKNRVERGDYEQIKILTEKGFKNRQIHEIIGWSDGVIYEVKKSGSYEEFINTMRSRIVASKAKKTVVPQNEVTSDEPLGYQEEVLMLLRKIANSLEARG